MKKLILIRHAKSERTIFLNDFDRPLLQIGIESANKVSKKTKELLPSNFSIWSSPAKRASDTCAIFVNNWNLNNSEIIYKNNLYTFSATELQKIVNSCSDNVNNLILFGHNTAITDFVNKFGNTIIDNVPTAGYVSIIFDATNWASIKNGKTDKIIFPRDL